MIKHFPSKMQIKLICLAIAVLICFTMFMPWLNISFSYGFNYENGIEVSTSMLNLKKSFDSCLDTLAGFCNFLGFELSEYDGEITLVGTLLSVITAVFVIVSAGIVICAIARMFIDGKLIGKISRISHSALIILTYAILIIGVIGGLYLGDMMGMVQDENFFVDVSIRISVWPIITMLLLLAYARITSAIAE